MGIYGEDWASYQSAAPDTTGLSFAFTKVTEGTGYVNPEWQSQRDHAKANGLVWGGYHYPHMGNSVSAEADHFLSQVSWKPGDLVCLDWEGYDAANSGVSKAVQAAFKDAFLRYVKGRLPHNPVGMYCNVDYWRNVDTTGYYGDFLWIATAGLPAGQPGISAPWLFHQYSAAGVDRDFCHLGSTAALREWALSFNGSTPTPPEDIVTPQDKKDIAALVLAELPGVLASVPAAVWGYNLTRRGDDWKPVAKDAALAAHWFVEGKDITDRARAAEATALEAKVDALSAQVAALVKLVTPLVPK